METEKSTVRMPDANAHLRGTIKKALAVSGIAVSLLCSGPLGLKKDLVRRDPFGAPTAHIQKITANGDYHGLLRQNVLCGDDESLSWSGYEVASSFTNPRHVITEVSGSWKVVHASFKADTDSAQWVGIGGTFSKDKTLIQTGTDIQISDGKVDYYVWFELIPNFQVVVPMKVRSGDIVAADIRLVDPAAMKWRIVLEDLNTERGFIATAQYASSMLSAEWVEERSIKFSEKDKNPHIQQIADFGRAEFGYAFTGSIQNRATIDGKSLPIFFAPHRKLLMVYNAGGGKSVQVRPSALAWDGSSFSVEYSKYQNESPVGLFHRLMQWLVEDDVK